MAYNFTKVKILLVECSSEMAQLLRSVLRMLTVPENNIDIAYSPEEAFEQFNQVGHDLIFTDWLEYPDRGLKFAKMIRRHPSSRNKCVPIIMTAGSGHREKVIKARDYGVSDYIVKPFSAELLARRITKIIEDEREFVMSENYVGPNRRFKDEPFEGEDRRKNTPQKEKKTKQEDKKEEEKAPEEAEPKTQEA